MIRLDIRTIPEAHIMTRWTRRAKDVIPEHLKGHKIEASLNKPLVVQSMQLNAKALEAISKGNTDTETLKVVMKHLNAAIKEVDGMLRSRKEKTVNDEVLGNDEIRVHIDDAFGTLTDVEGGPGNCYGAAGSCAHLSDTEIIKLRAPIANRCRGRPRANRYRSASELGSKKSSDKDKNSVVTTDKRKEGEETEHSKAVKPKAKRQRKTKELNMYSEENRGLPFQSRFCSKCKQSGHNRTTCGRQSKPQKKKTQVNCSKCDLKGHTETECLVVDDDSDSFFK